MQDATPTVHADGGNEFTLCGLAFDAFDSGDHDEPVVMARPGEVVRCAECRAVIDYVKSFKRYRQPEPESPDKSYFPR